MIYDATYDRELDGLLRRHLVYEWGPNQTGIYDGPDRTQPWTIDKARHSLRDVGDEPIMLDDETVTLSSAIKYEDEAQLERDRDKLAEIVRVAKVAKPNSKVTSYRTGQPWYHLRDLATDRERREADASRQLYDRLPSGRFGSIGLIDMLHEVTAVLYYRHAYDWLDYAEATIKFMRKFQKPVIGLIMPYYHAGHVDQDKAGKTLPITLWREQLAFCAEKYDETAVWHYPAHFGKPMPEEHRQAVYDQAGVL